MWSQWMPSSKKASPPGHRFVVPPVVGGLEPLRDGGEVREHELADRALGQQPAQADRQRLVVIVLADDHHPPRAIPGIHGRGSRPWVRRLLDEHVLAGRQGAQGQLQVEAGGTAITTASTADRRWPRGSPRSCSAPPYSPAVAVGPGAVAAGVAADHLSRLSDRRTRLWTAVMKPHPRKAMCSGSDIEDISSNRWPGRTRRFSIAALRDPGHRELPAPSSPAGHAPQFNHTDAPSVTSRVSGALPRRARSAPGPGHARFRVRRPAADPVQAGEQCQHQDEQEIVGAHQHVRDTSSIGPRPVVTRCASAVPTMPVSADTAGPWKPMGASTIKPAFW